MTEDAEVPEVASELELVDDYITPDVLEDIFERWGLNDENG